MQQGFDFSLSQDERISTNLSLADGLSRPYLTTSKGILFNNDCLNIFPHLRDESIHTIFADPPFNLGKKYKNGRSDSLDDEKYLDWTYKWLSECVRPSVPIIVRQRYPRN